MDLVDDILLNMFSYLSIIDCVRMQRVSTRWHKLIKYGLWQRKHFTFSIEMTRGNVSLVDLFRKCRNLSSLNYDGSDCYEMRQFYRKKWLKIVSVKIRTITSYDLSKLYNSLPNAKVIKCNSIFFNDEESFKRIATTPTIIINGAVLRHKFGSEISLLNDSLESLNLMNNDVLGGQLIQMLGYRSALKYFFAYIWQSSLNDICTNFPNLVFLHIKVYHLGHDNYNHIARLQHLRILRLYPKDFGQDLLVFDGSVAVIFQTCINLRKVDIRSAQIGINAIKHLSALKYLIQLNLFKAKFDFQPECFELLSNLQHLQFIRLDGLFPENCDKHLSVFIKTCDKLNFIVINNEFETKNVVGYHIYNSCIEKASNSNTYFTILISDNVPITTGKVLNNCSIFIIEPSTATTQEFIFRQKCRYDNKYQNRIA
jgi:F-box domain